MFNYLGADVLVESQFDGDNHAYKIDKWRPVVMLSYGWGSKLTERYYYYIP